MVLVKVAAHRVAPDAGAGRPDAGRGRRHRRQRATCASCSSTSRGASGSCRPGTEAVFFGKVDTFQGGLQMTNPIVDLIGDQTGRIVAALPAEREAADHHLGHRRLGRGGARQVPAAGPRRAAARGGARPVRLGRPHAGASATSTRPSRWPRWPRPAGGSCSTSCCACSWRWCCASGRWSATRRASATTPTAALVAALPRPAARSRSPRAQRRAIGEITSRPGRRRTRCTGCCRATSARQDGGRGQRAAGGGAGRSPGRADGADRGAGRAALPRHPRSCSTASRSPPTTTRAACSPGRVDRPLRVELLTNRTTAAKRPQAGRRRWPTAGSTSWSAPTR